MKTRPLRWDDVTASICTAYAGLGKPMIPVKMTDGRVKVYARLKMCSFVCKELWLENPNLNNPVLQAVILMQLQKNLRKVIHRLKTYESLEIQVKCKCCGKKCYQEVCHECKKLLRDSVDAAVK